MYKCGRPCVYLYVSLFEREKIRMNDQVEGKDKLLNMKFMHIKYFSMFGFYANFSM